MALAEKPTANAKMMVWTDETGSISPVPQEGRISQKVMAAFGLLSTTTATLLWLHMAYRLLLWKLEDAGWNRKAASATSRPAVDLSLGLPESAYRQAKSVPQEQGRVRAASLGAGSIGRSFSSAQSNAPNPLLILIHNLILADVFLSACYLENIVWVRENAILVGSVYCHAQGWLVSLGCLSSSMFLASMALYTYLTIIHGYKPRGQFVLINILLVWATSLILTCIPPLASAGTDLWGRNNLWVCRGSRDTDATHRRCDQRGAMTRTNMYLGNSAGSTDIITHGASRSTFQDSAL